MTLFENECEHAMLKKNGIFQNDVVLWNLLNGKERTVHVKESKEVTRLHMLRKLWLVKLVFCLIWFFSPMIFVIFVRFKKTKNKSKEENRGVLTFCTHLGLCFLCSPYQSGVKDGQPASRICGLNFPVSPSAPISRTLEMEREETVVRRRTEIESVMAFLLKTLVSS